jgi:hypothetical protein
MFAAAVAIDHHQNDDQADGERGYPSQDHDRYRSGRSQDSEGPANRRQDQHDGAGGLQQDSQRVGGRERPLRIHHPHRDFQRDSRQGKQQQIEGPQRIAHEFLATRALESTSAWWT